MLGYCKVNDRGIKGRFGWSDLGRKERERKKIGSKWIYFYYLIEGKNWEEKVNSIRNSVGLTWITIIFFPSAYGHKLWGKGANFLFPLLALLVSHGHRVHGGRREWDDGEDFRVHNTIGRCCVIPILFFFFLK